MQSVALSSIVVLVLAAGKGRRFAASGAQVHKLQAMLEGVSVLDRVCQSVAEAGLMCHVVEPAGDATEGMGDSIAHGVQATSDAVGWLSCLVICLWCALRLCARWRLLYRRDLMVLRSSLNTNINAVIL
ncbi:hypothetical protein [uncultured Comamonas sp.]|uniref:hypothetical protein n=1 Tax=Comamonas kerstersii TaxID=225992 RepID=UPI00338D8502